MPLPAPYIQQLITTNFPKLPSVTGLPQPITAKSVEEFLWALCWGSILLVSFTGWGRVTAKLFRIPQLPAAIACSLGIGTVVSLGGILDRVHVIYASILIGMAVAGLLLYLILHHERPANYKWTSFWKQASTRGRLLIVAALVIFALRAAGTVRLAEYDVSDDSSAYLVFPQKMLATHHFALDPFSERRVTSGLGGAYFLQSTVISATSLPHIAMADRTLGLILLAGILFELGIYFNLSTSQIALLEFLVCLVPQETFNLTFIVLPVSLLLTIAWMIWQASNPENHWMFRYSFFAGMVGGAVIALKSSYLPVVGTLLFVPYLVAPWKNRSKLSLAVPFIAGLGVLVVLAAWMISMKLTSDTYLFPILGRGLDYSRLNLFPSLPRFSSWRSMVKVFLQAFALLALVGIQVLGKWKEKRSRFNIGVLLASALAITAMNFETGADSIWRYNFPQFFSAVIIFYIVNASLFTQYPTSRRLRLGFYAGSVFILSMVFYYDMAGVRPTPFRQMSWEIHGYRRSLRAGLSGEALSSPLLQERYAAIEAAIPTNGTSLENVAYPYLLNYKSHRIFMMDWPGASAPLPGWPFGQDATDLARYLTQNSVRYVLYDYGYTVKSDAIVCQISLGPYNFSTWLRQQLWMTLLVDHQLNHLRTSYHSNYDDGQIAVIDLDRPIANGRQEQPAWTLNTDRNEMCSTVMARYLKNPLPAQSE